MNHICKASFFLNSELSKNNNILRVLLVLFVSFSISFLLVTEKCISTSYVSSNYLSKIVYKLYLETFLIF